MKARPLRTAVASFATVVLIATATSVGFVESAGAANPGNRKYTVALNGAAEAIGPGDADGTGTALVKIAAKKSRVCVAIKQVRNIVLPATGAHIHQAPAGSEGPIVLNLVPPNAKGKSKLCAVVSPTLLAGLTHTPTNFYVNVHNGPFPGGAIRGQVQKAPPGGGADVTTTYRYGPFTLGPGGEVMGSPGSGMPRPAGAFGLKGATFDIVDESFTPVSAHDVHLHHIVFTTPVRKDRLCPIRPERFMGSGMERTPISFSDPYAYLVGANDPWGSIYHVMNETAPGSPAKTVYIQYTLTYEPGANASNSLPLVPLFQDVTGCGASTYQVPGNGGPGSVHTNSRAWTAPATGIAVFSGGHLHEGGIDISLKDATSGQTMCTGVAEYHTGTPYHLATIPGCPLNAQMTAGHSYRVTSRYDNSQPYADVMGIMLTYVWEGT